MLAPSDMLYFFLGHLLSCIEATAAFLIAVHPWPTQSAQPGQTFDPLNLLPDAGSTTFKYMLEVESAACATRLCTTASLPLNSTYLA